MQLPGHATLQHVHLRPPQCAHTPHANALTRQCADAHTPGHPHAPTRPRTRVPIAPTRHRANVRRHAGAPTCTSMSMCRRACSHQRANVPTRPPTRPYIPTCSHANANAPNLPTCPHPNHTTPGPRASPSSHSFMSEHGTEPSWSIRRSRRKKS